MDNIIRKATKKWGGEAIAAAADGPVTLSLSGWSLATTPEFKTLADGFHAANPDVTRPAFLARAALQSLHFPPDVREVVIGADNDPAGRAAAEAAAHAYARRGLKVRIIRPLDRYKDFNDELRGAR